MDVLHYYNEFDAKTAAWLRSLISAGLIPNGVVDERSITEVQPADLMGYVQHHFFAGIGGWSLALRLAGWPADRRVWTGSCPCQPFSTAGKRKGKEDERHLWPVWFELLRRYNAISQREPVHVFGEQVASAIRYGWLDGVRTDLEAEGYTCGHAVLGAHSVRAPHIRQRLYWVANSGKQPSQRNSRGLPETQARVGGTGQFDGDQFERPEHGCTIGGMGFSDSDGRESRVAATKATRHWGSIEPTGGYGRVGNTDSSGLSERIGIGRVQPEAMEPPQREAVVSGSDVGRLGFAHGGGCGQDNSQIEAGYSQATSFWSDFDLIPCRDGKTRRVKSGVRCLAHGIPGRVAQLRGLGNAIVPACAAEFIKAFLDVEPA